MTNYELSKGQLLLEAGQLLGELGLTVYEN